MLALFKDLDPNIHIKVKLGSLGNPSVGGVRGEVGR